MQCNIAYEKAMDLAHDTEGRSQQNVFLMFLAHGTHNVYKPDLCCDYMFARFKASSSGVRLVAVVGACIRLM